jgi:N-methylhydantoinase A
VSVERGIDPRGCVLIAFGGGGGLHACGLAEQLGMRTVLVPPFAGVLSALGLAIAAPRREALASVMRTTDALTPDEISALCEDLERRVPAGIAKAWLARARYRGQGHELEIEVAPGDSGDALAARFADMHRTRYGFDLDLPVEVVSARYAATGEGSKVVLARHGEQRWDPASPYDDGGRLEAMVRGPMAVALPDATMFVASGWTARSLPIGGWLMERDS